MPGVIADESDAWDIGFPIAHAQSSLLEPGDYFYDAWRLDDGSRVVGGAGKFVVLPEARY